MKNADIQNTKPLPEQQLDQSPSEWSDPVYAAESEKGIHAILAMLPRLSDEGQKRAAGNILKFLAALIILTLVARGTAGATLAKVDIDTLTRGEIVESVTGSAIVSAEGRIEITAPEGLTVQEMLVGTGQSIENGDAVARFDLDEIKDKLERELSILEGMRLKLIKLEREEQVDTSSVKSAKTSVERARDDYTTVKMQGEADVANAQTTLNKAVAKEAQMRSVWQSAPAQAEAEARRIWQDAVAYEQKKLDEFNNAAPADEAAAREAWEQAKKATQEKKNALDCAFADAEAAAFKDLEAAIADTQKAETALNSAIDKANQDLVNASRKIEDANLSLSKAEQDQKELRQKAADTEAQNSIDAKVQRLDIEKQEALVAELQTLLDQDGVLYTGINGVVNKAMQQNDVTGAAAFITLADNTGVFEAEIKLEKAEAEKLATGDECEVTTKGGSMYYTPTVSGTISSISSPNEEGLVTVTVRLPEGEWTGGQSVKVQFVQSRDSYDMCIPLSALRSDNSGYYIFKIEQHTSVLGVENIVIRTPVTVQAMDDNLAAISGPVERDAAIVTGSNKAIDMGDRVRVNAP